MPTMAVSSAASRVSGFAGVASGTSSSCRTLQGRPLINHVAGLGPEFQSTITSAKAEQIRLGPVKQICFLRTQDRCSDGRIINRSPVLGSSRGGFFGGKSLQHGPEQRTVERRGSRAVQCRADDGARNFDLSLDPAPVQKFGSKIEIDQLDPKIRNGTMRAVDELGLRVTVGDVASKAGIKVAEAERALKALAADANGFLEVSDEGDVLFCLPRDYRSVLAQKSFRLRAEPYLKKAEEVGSYLVRVSFGTTLLASIVLVYTTIVVLATSSSSSDRDNRNRNSYGGSYGYRRGPSLGLMFDLSDILWYWNPNYRRRRQASDGEMNFFESVFSFVFGDGDPNADREEYRWKEIGKFIAQKGGVVTAEELAPFLDPPRVDEQSEGLEDESYVLPALQRFDGTPEVDEQGNLLYRFPALQRTAKELYGWPLFRKSADADVQDGQAFYQEKTWGFSQAPQSQKLLAVGLGLANLVGVLVVSSMLRNPQLARELGIGLVSFVQKSLPFLQGYAASFFAIPAFRWLSNQRKNAQIESRNSARMSRAMLLKQPSAPLRRKLINAREKAEKVVISKDKVIYSTEKDLAEQDIEAADWMGRLRQREEDRSR